MAALIQKPVQVPLNSNKCLELLLPHMVIGRRFKMPIFLLDKVGEQDDKLQYHRQPDATAGPMLGPRWGTSPRFSPDLGCDWLRPQVPAGRAMVLQRPWTLCVRPVILHAPRIDIRYLRR
jgi:hypothetical protein